MPRLQLLEDETKRQLMRIREKRRGLRILNESDQRLKDAVKNLDAYIKDTAYFLDKKDMIRAFEAVVYAWGILETLENMHLIGFRKRQGPLKDAADL